MVSFLAVGLGTYYGGITLFGLARLDWAAPAWSAAHVGLIAAGSLLGALAGLFGFAYAMTVEVRSERLSDFFIVVWQFLANGSMVWLLALGIAMSVSLGREEAKTAVLRFGTERATIHVVGTGIVVGLLCGTTFFLCLINRLPVMCYLIPSTTVSLLAAHSHFHAYRIESGIWVIAGLVVPILLLLSTPSMIERDRRQRRLVLERSS
jgi:hypothetical protein